MRTSYALPSEPVELAACLRRVVARRKGVGRSERLIQIYILVQIVCQLALLPSVLAPFRSGFRVASFGFSLLMLAMVPGRAAPHPASRAALVIFGLLIIELFHPTTNGIVSGAAQIGMYAAILAPLFWAARAPLGSTSLRRILLILWLFHTASAAVGILQVRFPGQFQPNLSSVIQNQGAGYVQSLYMSTSSGVSVLRPMGLTDMPGGAGMAGLYAVLFGIGFYLLERRSVMKALQAVSILIGIVAVLLCQVRSLLVALLLCVATIVVILAKRGSGAKLVTLAGMIGAVMFIAAAWTFSLAEEAVTKRLSTLVQSDTATVYYTNRGHFLEQTVYELLPRYPLGAGLGRWGMMNAYFGSADDPSTEPIYVEIQWTGWLLDGGLPLILAYSATLWIAVRTATRIALTHHHGSLWLWGVILAGYNVGACALTFNYPVFIGQLGLEFWLFNALIFAAARSQARASLRSRVV